MWDIIHKRRFYQPWYGISRELNAMTKFDEGLTMNIADPLDYPGYYLPFYLDRRVAWGVGAPAQARQVMAAAPGRFVAAVFFDFGPDGRIRMRMLRAAEMEGMAN